MDVSSELHSKKSSPHCSLVQKRTENVSQLKEESKQRMFTSPVKPSVSALLCLCLVGERWGTGQIPSVHYCSQTWDVSVLVLMLAQRCISVLIQSIRDAPQLVNGQSQTDADKPGKVGISPTCHFEMFMHIVTLLDTELLKTA